MMIDQGQQYKRDKWIDPKTTAILVVDVQKSEIDLSLKTEKPFYHETVTTSALPKIAKLISAGRCAGIEIVYTVIEALTDDGRDRSLDHKLSNMLIPRGSQLGEVIDDVAPQRDEMVFKKTSSGVFNSTNIDYVLRNLGIENVIVAGFLTDQCVDMAVRDGADRGYYMICAHDGCATYSKQRHENALSAFGGYCVTHSVDELAAIFETSDGDGVKDA